MTVTVLLCAGKHCRKALGTDTLRSLTAAAAEGGGDSAIRSVDCLSQCEDAPVLIVQRGQGASRALKLFGGMHKAKPALALCDMLAGRAPDWPGRLLRRERKLRKKTERAVDDAIARTIA